MRNGIWLDTVEIMRPCFVPNCKAGTVGLASKVGEGRRKRMFDATKETRLTIFYCVGHEKAARDFLASA